MKNNAYKTYPKNILTKYVISIIISAVLLAAASIAGAKSVSTFSVILYVLSIASALSLSTLGSIEALMDKRFEPVLLRNLAVLVLFLCGAYSVSAFASVAFCFSNMISIFSNISASTAYIKNNKAQLEYSVVNGESMKTVAAEKLKLGDVVAVEKGDYLCFDGVLENGSKQYYGVYKGEPQKIRVTQSYDYSVDFHAMLCAANPIYNAVFRYYPLSVLLIAVILAALKLIFAHTTVAASLFSPAAILLLCMPDMIISGIGIYFAKFGNAAKLEKFNSVKNIVVNMSGVLTKGELSVGDMVCKQGYDNRDVISMCAAVQPNDNKFAKAFLSYLGAARVATVPSEYLPHLGVKAEISGRTVLVGSEKLMNDNGVDCSNFDKYTVFVAVDGELIAAVKLNDTLSAEACKAMHELKAAGYNTYVVTANNSLTAKTVADNCGSNFAALCDDKAAFINQLKKRGSVAYIGDDEKAAAAADVSVLGGTGSLDAIIGCVKAAKDAEMFEKTRLAVGFAVSAGLMLLMILNVIRGSLLWLIALLIAATICLPEYLAAKQLEK